MSKANSWSPSLDDNHSRNCYDTGVAMSGGAD